MYRFNFKGLFSINEFIRSQGAPQTLFLKSKIHFINNPRSRNSKILYRIG